MKPFFLTILTLFLVSSLHASEKVTIEDGISFWYVCMEFRENFDKITEKIDTFLYECEKQNLQSMIDGNMFCIMIDSSIPIWGLGYPVKEELSIQPPLKVSQFDYRQIAKIIHDGPYNKVTMSIYALQSYLDLKGYYVVGPDLHFWLNSLEQIKKGELLAELIFPIREKRHCNTTTLQYYFDLIGVSIHFFLDFFVDL